MSMLAASLLDRRRRALRRPLQPAPRRILIAAYVAVAAVFYQAGERV